MNEGYGYMLNVLDICLKDTNHQMTNKIYIQEQDRI